TPPSFDRDVTQDCFGPSAAARSQQFIVIASQPKQSRSALTPPRGLPPRFENGSRDCRISTSQVVVDTIRSPGHENTMENSFGDFAPFFAGPGLGGGAG